MARIAQSRLFARSMFLCGALCVAGLSSQPLFATGQEFAFEFADAGDGSAEDPWVGWEDAITSDTEVIFIKGYYETPTTAISLPSNVVLTGVDGAILQWPEERTTIEDMLAIPPGTANIEIRGLQFEAGVEVPLHGLESGAGNGYIGIGTEGDNDEPVYYVNIHDNRFGVARYGMNFGNHLRVNSSVEDLIIRNNYMDSAPTNVRIIKGSNTSPGPTYRRLIFESNVVSHSQAWYAFGGITSSPAGSYTYPAQFEDWSIVDNMVYRCNGGFGVDIAGHGLTVSGNTVTSNNLDGFLWISGGLDGFVVSANTCYGSDPCAVDPNCTDDPDDVIEDPNCLIKIVDGTNGVIVGNTLRSGEIDLTNSQDIVVASNFVDSHFHPFDWCMMVRDSTYLQFHDNTCKDVNDVVFFLNVNVAQVDHIEIVNNEVVTTGSSPLTDYFIYSNGGLGHAVVRGNRVRGQDMSIAFMNSTSSSMNKSGNIESVDEVGFRIGSDEIADATGNGLEVDSGSLRISWDTTAEINGAMTDDSFATLNGVETLQNKTLVSSTNTFPPAGIVGFVGTTATTYYFGPNVGTKNATESAVSMRVPRMTVGDLECKVSPSPTGSQTWTMAVRDDGSDTAVTCTINSSSGGACQYTSSGVVVESGSQLALKATPANSPGLTSIQCVVGVGS